MIRMHWTKFFYENLIDQFGRKKCRKKRKDVDYELLGEFFQKYFFVHELWDVKDALSTYVQFRSK